MSSCLILVTARVLPYRVLPLALVPRDRSIFATRQLAKRQITWLRAMQDAQVLDCLDAQLTQRVSEQTQRFLQL